MLFFQENNQQCDRNSCTSAINCCLTSNPCENGGTCLSQNNALIRFKCACSDRYRGPRCQNCIAGYTGSNCDQRITSCRGYSNSKRAKLSSYVIRDLNDNIFRVYCDFDTNSNITWTLIQSYSLKYSHLFRNKSFSQNFPRPFLRFSWNSFRLNRFRMESIRNESTKWRITCDLKKTKKAIFTDYVQASNSEFNILTFNGSQCINVEYINVGGHNCSNCTASFSQYSKNRALHSNPLLSNYCGFKIPENKSYGHNLFGYYHDKD